MADILVLMRHGKAQRPTEDMLDMERKLTEAGKRALSATLPHSLALMPRNAAVRVWSSPAARAEQTARLLVSACKREGIGVDPDIQLVDTLWSQDADPFLDNVRACDADVVVAVGHNPFIEDLTARLTGSRIVFATGGLAAIALSEGGVGADSPYSARLLWFAQGPMAQRWKTLVCLEGVLAGASDTMQERLAAFFADPDDIETMHKFRVSVRTLRSLLAFVKPWQDAAQNETLQAELKAIVAETSRLRELDVLCEQASALQGASPDVVEFCASEALHERQRTCKALSSKKASQRIRHAASELNDVKWRKRVRACGLDAAAVRARFDGLASQLQEELAMLDLADAEQTHDVRKKAKRVRYDAEQLDALLGDDAVDVAKGMTAHQDNLGAICDARVNIGIINGLPLDELPEPVAWDLSLLRAQNETFLYTALRNG